MKKTGKQNIRWNTMKILAVGFLSVIFLGAVLLWLPVSNEKSISFLDALFTSTSSVCVTGLVTIVPKYQFTITGKVILLILIQIGGLGVIACITAFFMLLKRKITVKERVVIQEAYNMDSLGGLVGLVRKILIGTVVVEGIGAVFYAIQFIRDYGVAKGIWYGIFHSISAFCNAGIDILGDDSLARYATDPLINIITMLLIILGGIGFTVWYDVIDNGKKIWHREIPRKCWFTRLKLHSKIAIITTGFLLIAGTVLNFALEYHNPATIGHLNTGQKLMVSAFQAVTTRTAGFSTFQQSGMYEETGFLNIILMFIGGSPGGTAGGLKTTTFALLFLAFHTMLRGGHDIECFRRKVNEKNFHVAFVTIMLALAIYITGTTFVAVIEPDTISFQRIMYETASAMATVGLSQDLTTHLRTGSKIVLMILMYIGRVGPMTIALLFAGKVNLKEKMRTLPTEKIMKKQFAVFGLGSFGESIALELQKLGCEVVAVDKDMERVNGIADSVSYAMQADIGDPEFIRSLGTRNLDAVVIAEAESLEASIMAALECKEIGVPNVIAKAKNNRHATVLKKIALSPAYSIVETPMPAKWSGKTLKELDVRRNYEVNVVGIKSGAHVEVNPDPLEVLRKDMVLILVGSNTALEAL